MENQTTTPTVPTANDPQTDQPNIIMIMVDQMRFPMHFPPGIGNADEFIEKYMPNLFKYIWSKGVRFANHYIAASDCTAGRVCDRGFCVAGNGDGNGEPDAWTPDVLKPDRVVDSNACSTVNQMIWRT